MGHMALYREFRPTTFDDVVGQDHIVQTLKNQIRTNTISHAYLFCGTRGTGKTSCAKIFAKAVNCTNNKNGSPCGECEVCKSILSGGNLDIMEIDAASNNRVDEIRDLKEKVNYLPSVGKYKVYIIDEVHMLTDSAFNALLKTLEEPPAHIIFILATTEPQKLPATILSRCMRFDFKLVSSSDLVALLAKVFDKTGTKYEQSALEQIAKAGKGSVRDTLSVAEMCKAFSNDNVTYNAVVQCLGITEQKVLFELSDAIIEKDGAKILDIIEELYNSGKNISVLLSNLCEYFQTLLAISLGSQTGKKMPQDVENNFKLLAQKADKKYLLDCLKKLCDAENLIRYSSSEKVYAQTTLLSLFYNDNLEIAVLKQKIEQLETHITSGVNQNLVVEKNTVTPQSAGLPKSAKLIEDKFSTSGINIALNASEVFGKIIAHSRESCKMLLFASLSDVADVELTNDGFIFKVVNADCKKKIEEHKAFLAEFLQTLGINQFSCELQIDEKADKLNKLRDLFGDKLKIEKE